MEEEENKRGGGEKKTGDFNRLEGQEEDYSESIGSWMDPYSEETMEE